MKWSKIKIECGFCISSHAHQLFVMYCGPPALFTLTRKLFRLKFQLYMFAYFTVVWHTFLISGFKVSYGLKKVKNNGWLRQNIDFSSISCMSNEAFPRKREKSQIYCWHDIISTADCRLRTGGEKRKPRINCRRQTTDFLSTCRVNLGYCVSSVLICSLNLGYQTLYLRLTLYGNWLSPVTPSSTICAESKIFR